MAVARVHECSDALGQQRVPHRRLLGQLQLGAGNHSGEPESFSNRELRTRKFRIAAGSQPGPPAPGVALFAQFGF